MLPIVALQVHRDGPSTTVTALYLGEHGEAAPIFPGAKIGLSAAWTPVARLADVAAPFGAHG
jgi:hypothetical protein